MSRAAPLLAVLAALGLAGIVRAEVIAHGRFRVALDASITPRALPRSRLAPIAFSLEARFLPAAGAIPPQLRSIRIQINGHGHLSRAGLPVCGLREIQPATNAAALRACRGALVGTGRFASTVRFTEQAPFPSRGRILAFNGSWHGRPAILAHIYGPRPLPTSTTIPFLIATSRRGTYRTTLRASLPRFSSHWGYVTLISLRLGARYRSAGRLRSYLSASCPAPPDLGLVPYRLARAHFDFTGRQAVTTTLTRTCRAR